VIRRPRAVLLDLDGTLLETLGDISAALNVALERHGRPRLPKATVASMVGDGARMLVSRAISTAPDDPEATVVLADFLAAYAANPTPETRWMPGARELLAALAERRIPAIVCTNKPGPLAREIVARMCGALVRATLGAGDTQRLKPDPEPILAALALASVTAEDAWMVGDGAQDIAAARAAGVFAVGLRGGYGQTKGADLEIDALDELIRWL
jgi:phosphoglycolate phosphatase